MARFDVKVKLTGKDGNAFSVLGEVKRGLQKAGATAEEQAEFMAEATSGDYHHLLSTAMDWVEVS